MAWLPAVVPELEENPTALVSAVGLGLPRETRRGSGGDSTSAAPVGLEEAVFCSLLKSVALLFVAPHLKGVKEGGLREWKLGSELPQVVQGLHPFFWCQRAPIQALML